MVAFTVFRGTLLVLLQQVVELIKHGKRENHAVISWDVRYYTDFSTDMRGRLRVILVVLRDLNRRFSVEKHILKKGVLLLLSEVERDADNGLVMRNLDVITLQEPQEKVLDCSQKGGDRCAVVTTESSPFIFKLILLITVL